MSDEHTDAIALANRILDRVNADADDDLAMLSRQLLRSIEQRDREIAAAVAAFKEQAAQHAPICEMHPTERALLIIGQCACGFGWDIEFGISPWLEHLRYLAPQDALRQAKNETVKDAVNRCLDKRDTEWAKALGWPDIAERIGPMYPDDAAAFLKRRKAQAIDAAFDRLWKLMLDGWELGKAIEKVKEQYDATA